MSFVCSIRKSLEELNTFESKTVMLDIKYDVAIECLSGVLR